MWENLDKTKTPYGSALLPPDWWVRCDDDLRQVYSVFTTDGLYITSQMFRPLEPFTLASHVQYLWMRWLQMGNSFGDPQLRVMEDIK